jgi:hypothetical protein
MRKRDALSKERCAFAWEHGRPSGARGKGNQRAMCADRRFLAYFFSEGGSFFAARLVEAGP